MIFFIKDFFGEKIKNLKRSHKKNPKKLKIFFVWLTLVIALTLIFYLMGGFSDKEKKIPLKINTELSESYLNPLKPKYIPSTNLKQNIQLTEMKQNIPLTEMKQNIPSTNLKQNISLTEMKQIIPLTEMKQIIPLTEMKQNIPSTNLKQNIPNVHNKFSPSKTNIFNEGDKSFSNEIMENNSFRNINSNKIMDEVLQKLNIVPETNIYQINDYNIE